METPKKAWVFYERDGCKLSIVCTHMMLEAWKLGIGSVWVRAFDSKQVAKAFNLPRHIKPVCLLPVGYPLAESTHMLCGIILIGVLRKWWKKYSCFKF